MLEKLQEGMLEVAGAGGYEAASVRAVLERTGLYRQAFYDNFTDRHSCYLAALEMGIERFEADMRGAARAEADWRGKLRAGLGALLDRLDAEPDLGRGMIVEVYAAGPAALEKRAAALKRAAGFLELAPSDSRRPESSFLVVAGIHTVIHARLRAGADGGFRRLLPELMYLALLPHLGAEAAAAEV
jgi:AcrR family transcriptional regulator